MYNILFVSVLFDDFGLPVINIENFLPADHLVFLRNLLYLGLELLFLLLCNHLNCWLELINLVRDRVAYIRDQIVNFSVGNLLNDNVFVR